MPSTPIRDPKNRAPLLPRKPERIHPRLGNLGYGHVPSQIVLVAQNPTALTCPSRSVQLFADLTPQFSASTKNSNRHAFAHLSWLGPMAARVAEKNTHIDA